MSTVNQKSIRKKLLPTLGYSLLIVADCAKEEHTVNFFDVHKGVYLRKKPLNIKNNLKGFQYLIEQSNIHLNKLELKPSDVIVTLEDPGSFSRNFIDKMKKTGFEVVYVNAAKAFSYRENTRASSDTLDLDGIVRATVLGKTYKIDNADSIYSQLLDSTRERSRLLEDQTRHKNQLHQLVDRVFPAFLSKIESLIESFSKGCINLMLHPHFSPAFFLSASPKTLLATIKKAELKQGEKLLEALQSLARKTLDFSTSEPAVFEMLRARLHTQLHYFKERQKCIGLEEKNIAHLLQKTPYALLTSIPGVGIVTAGMIAAELGSGIGEHSVNEIASYAGLVPRQKQSGGSKSQPTTYSAPKAANKRLKCALYTASSLAKKYDHPSVSMIGVTHPLKEKYKEVALRNGSAYSATSKKFIRICVAMIRDKNIYMPDISSLTSEQTTIWIETGTQKMLDKWLLAGIKPNDSNVLGEWIQQKDKIIEILNTDLK